jgi:nucleoside-diphosphate-sugar epimerase
MKNIFIVGATNQIGCFLIPMLKDNYNNFALSRNEYNDEKINWVKSDINELDERTIDSFEIDILIYIGSMEYIHNFLNKFRKLDRLVLFSSTSAITKQDSNVDEERRLSKNLFLGEENAKQWCKKNNVNITILRPTLIYGVNKDKNVTVITNFITRFNFFPIVGVGKGLRMPVHAHDLANVVCKIIDNSKTYGKTYNLTGLETLTYKEMVERIFLSLRQKTIIINIPESLFKILLTFLKVIPKYSYLSTGMADRINQDLCFDTEDAQRDFDYSPMPFIPNKDIF